MADPPGQVPATSPSAKIDGDDLLSFELEPVEITFGHLIRLHETFFATRTPRGRYQFVFYKDSVVVWGPGGPDKETASYPWEPKRRTK